MSPTVPSDQRSMPSVDLIVAHWKSVGVDWVQHHGWGEPFCFGCGWLPPVTDRRAMSWRWAGPWLDRAHLQDHWVEGDDSVENLVMLCHLCHAQMPQDFEDRAEALLWVQQVERCSGWWQLYTDLICEARGMRGSEQ